MNLNKRLEALEATNKPRPELKWTPEEKEFREDIHRRLKEAGTNFYHEVCNDEEFERAKRLSSKASLIWYRENIANEPG